MAARSGGMRREEYVGTSMPSFRKMLIGDARRPGNNRKTNLFQSWVHRGYNG